MQNIPTHRQVFIGVEDESWLTLFGPPPELEQLFSYSAKIEAAPKLKLAAYGAVHSPHLPVPDLEAIVGKSPILSRSIQSNVQVLCTSTGIPYSASTLRDLYLSVCREIVSSRLKMGMVLRAAAQGLQSNMPVRLNVIGLTQATPIVKRVLDSHKLSVALHDKPAALSEQSEDLRDGSNAIAIVGMAGRFPGSESLEEFWQSLMDGLDAHQEVCTSFFRPISRYLTLHRSPMIDSISRRSTTPQVATKTPCQHDTDASSATQVNLIIDYSTSHPEKRNR